MMVRQRKTRGRLFWKYVVLFVALISGALLASGGLEIYFSYQENKTALARIQSEKAAAAASTIQQFMQEFERQLGWTTHLPFVLDTEGLEQRRLDYLRLLRQVPAIMEIIHLDPSGKEQLRISRWAMDVVGSKKDFSREPEFLEATALRTYYSPVYFRQESEPYLTLAMADRVESSGVNVAEVNLKFMWDVISEIKVGKAGYAYVVDSQGRLIAHPDISLVLRQTDFSSLPQVEAARTAPSTPVQERNEAVIASNISGIQVLTAHAAMGPLGWIVFVESPLDEAFAPLYSSILRTMVLLLMGLFLSALASLLLVRKMVIPIRALQTEAARIGAGDLSRRIDIRTGDELEALADQFNHMTAQLQESYAHLEQRVEERTRELSEAHQTVQKQATRLETQSTQLAEWNRELEQRVREQLDELERAGRLKRFLPPQLADLIVSSGDEHLLESHRREITVVFCDLRGFTAFAETAEPEEVMGVLSEYHSALGSLIFRFEGTLDSFIGDGLMVFFNDPLPCPDPEARAVRMGVAMHECVDALIGKWRKHGHQLGFGVGISQGYATLGRIGFEGRFDYSAIGSVTNLASRLCDEAKAGQTLISQSVNAKVEALVVSEPVGNLTLKGFHRPVAAYNIVRLKD
ncbi:MAG: HAMP domain-containing protein [Gemmatimonadetes bacterium]|nr:HAMP domain-containing protein [Gemmatimonadota bacterium]